VVQGVEDDRWFGGRVELGLLGLAVEDRWLEVVVGVEDVVVVGEAHEALRLLTADVEVEQARQLSSTLGFSAP
jgi:hypothetical protein